MWPRNIAGNCNRSRLDDKLTAQKPLGVSGDWGGRYWTPTCLQDHHSLAAPDMGYTPKCSLSPTVKHTDQE